MGDEKPGPVTISHFEGALRPAQHTLVLTGDLNTIGWTAVMAAKGQPQPIDEAENFPKQFPRHRNLGQLQSDIAAVAHDLGANLAPL